MREIKFRAYDKQLKKMFVIESIDFQSGTVVGGGGIYPCDSIELMQFTGLHDKNGKEIYEGDIVEADWGYGCPRREVEFDTIYYAKAECSLSDEIKVIGNIYENPELLKGV